MAKETEMAEDTPLLDTLAAMAVASLEICNLEPRELMLARIAARVRTAALRARSRPSTVFRSNMPELTRVEQHVVVPQEVDQILGALRSSR